MGHIIDDRHELKAPGMSWAAICRKFCQYSIVAQAGF
jgi:hypothetical protein